MEEWLLSQRRGSKRSAVNCRAPANQSPKQADVDAACDTSSSSEDTAELDVRGTAPCTRRRRPDSDASGRQGQPISVPIRAGRIVMSWLSAKRVGAGRRDRCRSDKAEPTRQPSLKMMWALDDDDDIVAAKVRSGPHGVRNLERTIARPCSARSLESVLSSISLLLLRWDLRRTLEPRSFLLSRGGLMRSQVSLSEPRGRSAAQSRRHRPLFNVVRRW